MGELVSVSRGFCEFVEVLYKLLYLFPERYCSRILAVFSLLVL